MSLVHLPAMVLVGAASRNAGKTELATRVVRRFAPERDVVGVKVTVASGGPHACPRGGAGCGACHAVGEQGWCLEEQAPDRDEDKDTRRLLDAGARRVWWLRAREERLGEAAAHLAGHLPAGAVVVGESNRLRTAVVPGVFLVVRRQGEPFVKPSCAAVRALADLEVLSDGAGFDLDLHMLAWSGSAVVLSR